MIPLFCGSCPSTCYQIGFACYHENSNPVDVIRRAVDMGEQTCGQQPYNNVRYINKYDWVSYNLVTSHLISSRLVLLHLISCYLM